jgi:hypothetical protein
VWADEQIFDLLSKQVSCNLYLGESWEQAKMMHIYQIRYEERKEDYKKYTFYRKRSIEIL